MSATSGTWPNPAAVNWLRMSRRHFAAATFGGHDVEGPAQSYTYFLVRGDGRYTVKVRDGDDVRSLVDFTESPAVPKADASGKARYALEARVATDSVRFLVNGAPVTTIAAKGLATNGIAGVRINHNLHVRVAPLTITRP